MINPRSSLYRQRTMVMSLMRNTSALMIKTCRITESFFLMKIRSWFRIEMAEPVIKGSILTNTLNISKSSTRMSVKKKMMTWLC